MLSEKIEEEYSDALNSQLEVAKTSAERHSKELNNVREQRNIINSRILRTKSSIEFVKERLDALQTRTHICPICMEKKCSVITPCGHLFCSQCIKKSLKTNKACPECRQDVEEDNIRSITLGGMGTKMMEIAKLIERINEPIVLFVQWKSMLRGIKSFLKGLGIQILSLEGNVSQRAYTLDVFKLGGVLLLCLEDSFAGLHLPHARYVIFSHAIVGDLRSVKLLEEQAVARCLRHGQTEEVKVYSFIVKDCDEEIIWKNTHEE